MKMRTPTGSVRVLETMLSGSISKEDFLLITDTSEKETLKVSVGEFIKYIKNTLNSVDENNERFS